MALLSGVPRLKGIQMRTLPIAGSMLLGLMAAGCGPTQSVSNADTGSMAYPAPRASGEFQRPAPTGVDTGSMAYPTTVRQGQTVPASENAGSDTGSMAYPTPRGAGTIRPSTTK